MHARQFLARHGEHAEWIIRPQVLLAGERELREVTQRPEVIRMHAGAIERGSVVCRVGVGMAQRPGEPLALQRGNLIARRRFDCVEACHLSLRLAAAFRLPSNRAGMTTEFGDQFALLCAYTHVVHP